MSSDPKLPRLDPKILIKKVGYRLVLRGKKSSNFDNFGPLKQTIFSF